MEKTIVIGNGIAGYTVAASLSKEGKQVVQYSEESYGFYSRIKLPQALCDAEALSSLPQGVEPPYLVHGQVKAIDGKGKQVVLSDGKRESYDHLVLATGSRCRTLPQFAGIHGVCTLRTLKDAKEISGFLKSPVCVLGGGLLGIEAARAISKKGFAVTVLEAAPHILNRQLNDEASLLLRRKLEAEGLAFQEGFCLSGVEQDGKGLHSVTSSTGVVVPCSTMILSLGVNPEVSLAKEAGIAVNRAIVVNDHLETSMSGVYAIGDCAEYNGMVPGIMPVALGMANTLTGILLGKEQTYMPPELMTRLKDDAFDLISIGRIEGDCHKKQDGEHYEFYFTKDDVLVGAVLISASSKLSFVKQSLGKPFSA